MGSQGRESNCLDGLGVSGMQSAWSVPWSTGKSIRFCSADDSPLTKTHSSKKAFLNDSPTGIQKVSIDTPNLSQEMNHQKDQSAPTRGCNGCMEARKCANQTGQNDSVLRMFVGFVLHESEMVHSTHQDVAHFERAQAYPEHVVKKLSRYKERRKA